MDMQNTIADKKLIQMATLRKIETDRFKEAKLRAVAASKSIMREIRADDAKENKFTTYTSQDRRTSTEINQANFVDSINARNEFWQEYYMHKAATN
jgi:hypothetical protein